MPELLALPFLTRQMLAFGHKAQLSLQISTWSSVATNISIRGMTKEGMFRLEHGTLGTGLPSTANFGISDIPIFISVDDDSDSFDPGELYVKISLRVNGEIVLQLAAGYVHQMKALSWPRVTQEDPRPDGGKLKVIEIANPAAATDFTQTVPENRTWRIKWCRFTVVNDAAGGSLRGIMEITDGTNLIAQFTATASTGDGGTQDYMLASWGSNAQIDELPLMTINMPEEVLIPEGFIIRSAFTGLEGTDQISDVFLYVEEFMETN